jgi:hypothetical protein
MQILNRIGQHADAIVVGKALRQRDDLRVGRGAPRHEGARSQSCGQHLRSGRRRGGTPGGVVEQRGLEGGEIAQRKVDVGIGEDDVGRHLGMLGGKHAHGDHPDTATAVMGDHRVVGERFHTWVMACTSRRASSYNE